MAPRQHWVWSLAYFLAAQRSEAKRMLDERVCLSVYLSVRPSVCHTESRLTVQDIKIRFAPYNRGMFIVS